MKARFRTPLPVLAWSIPTVIVALTAGLLAPGGAVTASPTLSADRLAAAPVATDPNGVDDPTAVSFQATTSGLSDRYIRHKDFQAVVSKITTSSTRADKSDATWIIRPGLADRLCVSFESKNIPGRYLRHSELRLVLQPPDGTKLFREDATFCRHGGKSGTGISLASFNYPDRYIRHYMFDLYIASNGGPNPFDIGMQWASDVSWVVARPWTP